MSRNVSPPGRNRILEEAVRHSDIKDGKILISRYQGEQNPPCEPCSKGDLCAFLIQNNRLTMAAVLDTMTSGTSAMTTKTLVTTTEELATTTGTVAMNTGTVPTTTKAMVGEALLGSIHVGKVKNVVKNIDACFVEITSGELCYLPLSMCRNKSLLKCILLNRSYDGRILEGDELIVQVDKAPIKTKQASLTTKITMDSPLFIFSTGSERANVSNKINIEKKKELYSLFQEHKMITEKGLLPQEEDMPPYGLVLRTAAAEQSHDELIASYQTALARFTGLFRTARYKTAPACLLAAKKPYQLFLHQIPAEEYVEIVTDEPQIYDELKACLPEIGVASEKLRFYKDTEYSLLKLYSIESRLKEALSARVWLKSGGYLVIEPTEALTVIDVNSGKYSAKKAREETISAVNYEAAREIALQIKLRNLSGIILVDFINMKDAGQVEELVEYMTQLVKQDRVKTVVVDMTPLGLLEITRKKVNQSLAQQFAKKEDKYVN